MTANKRKRNEEEPQPTTAMASNPHGGNNTPQGHRMGKTEPVEARRRKRDDPHPTKKRREYIPCQPPTLREGTLSTKLAIEWVVKKETVWEGENSHEIVRIQSDFASQVKGTPKSTNPHWSTTKPSPPPTTGLNCAYPITAAAFPNVALPEAAIMGNVRKEVADELKCNPNEYMALIPIGAGNRLYDNEREMTTAVARLVNALADDNTQYRVAPPVREGDPPYGARFAKPFAMVLQKPSTKLRHMLLAMKTLAFRMEGKGFAFIATEITPKERSWVVCNYKGSPVTNDVERMADALRAIGRQIEASAGLRSLANRILKDEHIGNTAEERIHVVLAGLSLALVDRPDENGQNDPIWQLHGRPLTKDERKNREWLRAIRQIDFFIDATTALEQERKPISCVWCKSETHTSSHCPLPLVKDWLGPPIPQEICSPEPRDTTTSREGKRGSRKRRKGKGRGNL